ncbi:MAG: hypothetical protein HeimC2_28350 [Candidatus Heimdallarchaeota archaeon LC_2]|nr:MAG: hypothetical protein HeimC2_28350 [Candidatus Heimdallarchaeota archaeon LC_2]
MGFAEEFSKGVQETLYSGMASHMLTNLNNLENLRTKNSTRWVWELLQNAKDTLTSNRKINAEFTVNKDTLIFKHSGDIFSKKDLNSIVFQTSSKDDENDETQESQIKKTGKFGTGFLTTNLLSKKIKVQGYTLNKDQASYSFKCLIDRDANTKKELIKKLMNTHNLLKKSFKQYEKKIHLAQLNTRFTYPLFSPLEKQTCEDGIEELTKLIPYVLSFVPHFKEIKIINNTTGITSTFSLSEELEDDFIHVIKKKKNNEYSKVLIAKLGNDKLSIACEMEKINQEYYLKNLNKIPKLFVNYPLIGTEKFPFPLLLNSPNLNPNESRNEIFLGSLDRPDIIENKEILLSAIELIEELFFKLESNKFHNLFYICQTDPDKFKTDELDRKWISGNILEKLRRIISDSKIIEPNDNTNEKKKFEDFYFPSLPSKILREEIWKIYEQISSDYLIKRDHIENWYKIMWDEWDKLNYSELCSQINELQDLNKVQDVLELQKEEAILWLNKTVKFILQDSISHLHNYRMVPNQIGDLKKITDLFHDTINDEALVNITEALGNDWKEILVHKYFDTSLLKLNVKTIDDVTDEIRRLFPFDSLENMTKDAVLLIIDWIKENRKNARNYLPKIEKLENSLIMSSMPEDQKELLIQLYERGITPKTVELFDRIRSNPHIIDEVEDLQQLYEKYGVSNIYELEGLINSNGILTQDQKEEITNEILIRFGVTNKEELDAVLGLEYIKNKFVHVSTGNFDYSFVERILDRAMERILNYLSEQNKVYDIEDKKIIAKTVAIIKKHDEEIHLIARPSDFGKVIIHFEEELAALDQPNMELWVQNGEEDPERLTLGEILRRNGITKFEV